jgi:hypothetical protein
MIDWPNPYYWDHGYITACIYGLFFYKHAGYGCFYALIKYNSGISHEAS